MMFIGNIIAYTGNDVPRGYLVCDGSEIEREVYPELFAVIGTTYGSGDGLSTFNLPNLSGKLPLCASQDYIIGATGGEETHSLTDTETPSHTHEIPQHTHTIELTVSTPVLTHTVSQQPSFNYTNPGNVGANTATPNSNYYTNGVSTPNMSITTNMSISNHPATACTVTGGILDCPAFNTEIAGSGLGHNNMMPYLAVTYLIKAWLPVPIEPGMAMYNGFMVATAGGGYISGKTV